MYLYMPSPSQQFVAQHSVDFFASATFLSYVLSSVRHYGLFGRQRVYVSNTCGRDWLRKSWRHSQRDWPMDSRRGSPRELPRDWRPYALSQFPLLPFTFCAFYLPPSPRLPSTLPSAFPLPPSTLYLLPSTKSYSNVVEKVFKSQPKVIRTLSKSVSNSSQSYSKVVQKLFESRPNVIRK